MNKQYFDEKQIKAGEMQKFLSVLFNQCHGKGKYYNDVHVYPTDGSSAFIVEWEQCSWNDRTSGGHFEYIEEGEVVMREYPYPDESYGQFYDEEDYQQSLKEWIKDNPNWKQDEEGHWYNIEERESWIHWREKVEEAKKAINETSEISQESDNKSEILCGLDENGIPQ